MNKKLIPVMLCFFAMGFVDMVGIASNYVKADLNLSDSMANTLPSLVFLWFLIFSIPTSLLMNKIGRKNTVLLSLVMTLVAMAIPVFTLDFAMLLLSFSLLGIGNAILQTSLNPLVDTVMKGGASASTLTFGQFIKSIASFLAPIIASWGATTNAFGLGWQALYPIYLCVGIVATLLLFGTRIDEEPAAQEQKSVGEQFAGAFALLGNPFILLCFLAIICHVGIDVGTSVTAPKILMERTGMELNSAAFVCTIYFVAKGLADGIGRRWPHLRPRHRYHLRQRGFDGLRQRQPLQHHLCKSYASCAREEERSERPAHHGHLRRHNLPASHGLCQRCDGTGRRRPRHGCRHPLPAWLLASRQEGLRLRIHLAGIRLEYPVNFGMYLRQK